MGRRVGDKEPGFKYANEDAHEKWLEYKRIEMPDKIRFGLCIRMSCDRPVSPGHKICDHHLHQMAVSKRGNRKMLLSEGLCTYSLACGQPPALGARYCAKHLEESRAMVNARSRALRAERQAAGRCIYSACSSLSAPGAHYCDAHLNEYRDRYHAKRTRGLCGYGGCKHPAEPGKTLCTEHRQRVREYYMKIRARRGSGKSKGE